MAIKFSLPKKKSKESSENLDILDLDTSPKPKKSLFGKRSAKPAKAKSDTFSVDAPRAGKVKLDKKKATILGVLVGILLIGAIVMFILPMLSQNNTPEPAPAPIAVEQPQAPTSEPASTPKADPDAELSATPTVDIEKATANIPESSATPATPDKEQETELSSMPISVDKTNEKSDEMPKVVAEAKPAPNTQKFMEENKNKKSAEQSMREQHTMSYADFVKASEQQVFTDR